MKIHQIKTFVQLAESGSIRAAARDMHISQSALTRNVKELEEEVGAELVNRSYRGIEFTPSGLAMLSRARNILANIDRAKDEIQQIQGGAGAKVTVGLTPVLTSSLLAPVYESFSHALPKAQLTFNEGLLTEIVPKLIEGSLDFGVAIAAASDLPTELTFEPLCQVKIMPAMRVEHPAAGLTDWESLLKQDWILNQSLGSSSNVFLQWLEEVGLPAPRRIIQCTSPFLMLEMIRRTDLIGLGPARLFADPMTGVGIENVSPDRSLPKATLGIIRVRGLALTPAADRLEAMIKKAITTGDGEELETGMPCLPKSKGVNRA